MLQVGDSATHAAFLAALASSHAYGVTVEAYFDGDLVDQVPIEDGTVSVNGSTRLRRRLEIVAPEDRWPTAVDDPLSPRGVWLRVLVTVSTGGTVFPAVPVFAGKLLTSTRRRRSGAVATVGVDPMWQINRESFETPRAALKGTPVVGLVQQLIQEVFPDATLDDQLGSAAVVPTVGLLWDAAATSRGDAIDELAAAVGAEVFARPTRVWPEGDFVIRPVPSVDTGTAAWTLTDGPGGVVENDQLELSGEQVVNRWIVNVEPTGGAALPPAVATDDSSFSPTRYGGPMGKLVDFYSSPLIGTTDQALAAARAKLARSLGLGDARQLWVLANPALEAGDLIAIRMGTEPWARHIVDTFEIPLSVRSATMPVRTRAVTVD